jgi:hypothetical protein
MRNKILHAFIALLAVSGSVLPKQSHAQSVGGTIGNGELAFGVGPMFFLGDLGGSAGKGGRFVKDVDFPLTKLAKSLYLSIYPSELFGLRVSLNHGVLEGDDSKAPDKGGAEVDRLKRNLSFRTSVLEGYIAAEIYPTVLFEKWDGLQGKLRPYGVIGIGIMKYNPKTLYNGKWVELQPLRLEGQGMAEYPDSKPYKLVQREIPMGVGAKYYLSDKAYIGFELLHRKLFTDYIDDVSNNYYIDPIYFDKYLTASQAAIAKNLYYRGNYGTPGTSVNMSSLERGNPGQNDSFFSTVVRFGVRLGGTPDPAKRQLRCPVFY